MKEVIIYTDGACRGNPGPGGWGTLLIYGKHRKELSGGYANTTNNRMELMAVIAGLEAVREKCQVTIFSDSAYIVKNVTNGAINTWKAKGWVRKGRKRVVNADLWQRLHPLLMLHPIKWKQVRGHSGIEGNERCDYLATTAARGENLPIDAGYVNAVEAPTLFDQSLADESEPTVDYDEEKLDQAALALLYLTLHPHDHETMRVSKQLDRDILFRLHKKGYLKDPRDKSKSVVVTEDGIATSRRLLGTLFPPNDHDSVA